MFIWILNFAEKDKLHKLLDSLHIVILYKELILSK